MIAGAEAIESDDSDARVAEAASEPVAQAKAEA
jgi:hypothetical protein